MSALGHKRTSRSAIAMSALPPKADMCSAAAYVRFGPRTDSCSAAKNKPLVDHLVGARELRRRNVDAKHLDGKRNVFRYILRLSDRVGVASENLKVEPSTHARLIPSEVKKRFGKGTPDVA